MATTILHIGLHKTGTTWLQDACFVEPDMPFIMPWSRNVLLNDFVHLHPSKFKATEIKKRYQPEIASIIQQDKSVVISHERFSGCPASGGYDALEIANRLESVFEHAEVVLFIRRQEDLILSYYKQYIRDGGAGTIEEFLYPPQPTISRVPYFSAAFYEYDKTIALYQSLFSKKRVHVFLYEEMRENPRATLEQLFAISGHTFAESTPVPQSEINPSITALQAEQLRYLHRKHWRNQLNPFPPKPIDQVEYTRRFEQIIAKPRSKKSKKNTEILDLWKSAINEYCRDKFETSNNATASITGLDLAAHDYSL